jgi:hypothetical protein
MTKTAKFIIALLFIFAFSCASQGHHRIISKDIYKQCVPSDRGQMVSAMKVAIDFQRFENCYGYKDLVVISWTPFNVTIVRTSIVYILGEYLFKTKKKAKLIQYEQYGQSFYVLYELSER